MAMTRLGMSYEDAMELPIRVLGVLVQTEADIRKDSADAAFKAAKRSKTMGVFDIGRWT